MMFQHGSGDRIVTIKAVLLFAKYKNKSINNDEGGLTV